MDELHEQIAWLVKTMTDVLKAASVTIATLVTVLIVIPATRFLWLIPGEHIVSPEWPALIVVIATWFGVALICQRLFFKGAPPNVDKRLFFKGAATKRGSGTV